MIAREIFSEFGHLVTLEVDPIRPENDAEFGCVCLTVRRNNARDSSTWWLSIREAHLLRHLLNDALCGDAFAALGDYQQADEDGVMVLVSRQAVDEIIALPCDSNRPPEGGDAKQAPGEAGQSGLREDGGIAP